ncbi:MAG: diguanylate cyclase [Herbaspirillum sp.]|jgi:diguanylate cyclase (GGDEF)-like protein/PAS domain S-box-containing protein|nr:diguanylate cyclase [Herbaspirillum sp.]
MLRKIKANIPSGCAVIALAGLLLSAGIWGYTIVRVRDEAANAVNSEIERNDILTFALEEQTARIVNNIDQLLLIVKDQAERPGTPIDLQRLVAAGIIDVQLHAFIAVVNADGDMFASTQRNTLINLKERDDFKQHLRNANNRLLIGKPHIGRITGRPTIQFSRRINRPNGDFGGMVAIGIDPRFFLQLYDKPRLNRGDIVALVAQDGIALARSTPERASFGQEVGNPALFRQFNAAPGIGLHTMATIDGIARFISSRKLADYDLIVAVGSSEDDIEAKAWRTSLKYYGVAGLETVLLWLFCGMLMVIVMRQRRSEMRIRNQASLLDKAQDAIIVRTLKDHKIVYWNKGAERLYGWSAEEALGQEITYLLTGDHGASESATNAAAGNGEWRGEIVQRHKNGSLFTVEGHWTLVSGEADEPESIFEINTNISHRKIAERKIQHLAYYDSVTGLPNRTYLQDRLSNALERSARTGHPGALLLIDLDNFKTLNDTLGHEQGDLLLQEVAARLQANARRIDTVARLGGDEFVLMLEDLSEQEQTAGSQVNTVGEKILNALSQPYELAGLLHHTSASIGITLFYNKEDQVSDLLKRADMAMYQAKAAGRNAMRFFNPSMQSSVARRAALEADLRDALKRDEFTMHYQPQVDCHGRITGAEALVRWRHPRHGLIAPAEFIPLAEDSGLIFPLGLWVLETACAQLAAWASDPLSNCLTMSVNVSARQFQHAHFVSILLSVLQQTGANPLRLKLELTESLFVTDMEIAAAKMSTLKAQGVEFSLDDFGTGYSSLSYLKRLPLNQLKIDQSFVRDILTDSNDSAIAIMIVALARSLGLEVIAEGVETAEQRNFLLEHGCPLYQGYLFSAPVPIDQFRELLATDFTHKI